MILQHGMLFGSRPKPFLPRIWEAAGLGLPSTAFSLLPTKLWGYPWEPAQGAREVCGGVWWRHVALPTPPPCTRGWIWGCCVARAAPNSLLTPSSQTQGYHRMPAHGASKVSDRKILMKDPGLPQQQPCTSKSDSGRQLVNSQCSIQYRTFEYPGASQHWEQQQSLPKAL